MPFTHTPFGVLRAEDAREMSQSPAVALDQLILEHTQRWQLVGIFLRCVSCGYSQKASSSEHPFPHHPECQACFVNMYWPWQELSTILQQVPTGKSEDADLTI